jgi:tetratricopeptide (TPR) repeat protein
MKTQLVTTAYKAEPHSIHPVLLQACRWVRQIGVLFTTLLFTTYPLPAQMTPQQKIVHAYTLEKQSKPAQAISEFQALLDSKSLDTPSVGKSWNILGLAYEDIGNLAYAQHALERSIHIFEGLPNNISDYAMALDDLGGIYATTGQLELAAKLRTKALHLYEKINDHTGIACASSDLAGIAFNQKKVREGRKYLDRALKEAQLTNDLGEDDLAAIDSMRGSLAQFDGDFRTAVSSYQQALDLWRRRHGEENALTGWGYALLGEAHAKSGNLTTGLAEMKQGLAVLGHALDHQDPRYLTAEIAYSSLLDDTGAHAEAAEIKVSAERLLKEFYNNQCVSCTISVAAFH